MSKASVFYDNLSIFDTSCVGWEEQLEKKLGYWDSSSIRPLKTIEALLNQLDCKTIIVEEEYVDRGFLDEFANYYCKILECPKTKCQRLHFFSHTITVDDIAEGKLDLIQSNYLGFCVVRPTLSYRLGRTLLKSPKNDGNRCFTLCAGAFDANLSGLPLKVTATPFIQQDTNVGVCAQAVLWMLSLYMHQRYEFPHFEPSEITNMATKSVHVGSVRTGLIPQQVVEALRNMGYEPEIFKFRSLKEMATIIYAYVESRIPVVLGLALPSKKEYKDGHAVLAIGHDFNVRKKVNPDWDSNIEWIDHFFIQDDAEGPYRDLFIRKNTKRSYSIEKQVLFAIVPVPKEVKLRVDDVNVSVRSLVTIERLNDFISQNFPKIEGIQFSAHELDGVIFRTYLRKSNDFKDWVAKSGMSGVFKHMYRTLRMPRYVWVTEISRANLLNVKEASKRKIIGEIVTDSTADRHVMWASPLSIHLLGRAIVKWPGDNFPSRIYIDRTEEPYIHLVRTTS